MHDVSIYVRQTAAMRVELFRMQLPGFLRLKVWIADQPIPCALTCILNIVMTPEKAWTTAKHVAIAGLLVERELDYCHRDNHGLPTRGHLPHGESHAILTDR